jgi:chaperonin GroES
MSSKSKKSKPAAKTKKTVVKKSKSAAGVKASAAKKTAKAKKAKPAAKGKSGKLAVTKAKASKPATGKVKPSKVAKATVSGKKSVPVTNAKAAKGGKVLPAKSSVKVGGKSVTPVGISAGKVAKPKKISRRDFPFLSPLDDRVLINYGEASARTPGGLYIPDTAGARPNRGTVLAVGPGRVSKRGGRKPLDVQVGDEVMFGEYAGHPLEVMGETYLILREDEILGVFE